MSHSVSVSLPLECCPLHLCNTPLDSSIPTSKLTCWLQYSWSNSQHSHSAIQWCWQPFQSYQDHLHTQVANKHLSKATVSECCFYMQWMFITVLVSPSPITASDDFCTWKYTTGSYPFTVQPHWYLDPRDHNWTLSITIGVLYIFNSILSSSLGNVNGCARRMKVLTTILLLRGASLA